MVGYYNRCSWCVIILCYYYRCLLCFLRCVIITDVYGALYVVLFLQVFMVRNYNVYHFMCLCCVNMACYYDRCLWCVIRVRYYYECLLCASVRYCGVVI